MSARELLRIVEPCHATCLFFCSFSLPQRSRPSAWNQICPNLCLGVQACQVMWACGMMEPRTILLPRCLCCSLRPGWQQDTSPALPGLGKGMTRSGQACMLRAVSAVPRSSCATRSQATRGNHGSCSRPKLQSSQGRKDSAPAAVSLAVGSPLLQKALASPVSTDFMPSRHARPET